VNRRDLLAGMSVSFAALGARARGADAPAATTSCVLTPVTSEGPYYFDPKLIRSDITDQQPGVPLALELRVVTVNGCAPIRNARVDVWHSNARGIYSGYEGQRGVGEAPAQSANGKTFLRVHSSRIATGSRVSAPSTRAGITAARRTFISRCSCSRARSR
jgi:hypothetical protein